MNIYIITPDNFGWDEYNEISVVARNIAEALELAEKYFSEEQKPLHVNPIDSDVPQVLTASFVSG